MAWIDRNGYRYYYRNQREGKRVRRIYCGTGEAGHRAAADDERRRTQRIRQMADLTALEHQIHGDLETGRAIADQIKTLTRAGMIAAGYHQHHHNEWRRRNDRAR